MCQNFLQEFELATSADTVKSGNTQSKKKPRHVERLNKNLGDGFSTQSFELPHTTSNSVQNCSPSSQKPTKCILQTVVPALFDVEEKQSATFEQPIEAQTQAFTNPVVNTTEPFRTGNYTQSGTNVTFVFHQNSTIKSLSTTDAETSLAHVFLDRFPVVSLNQMRENESLSRVLSTEIILNNQIHQGRFCFVQKSVYGCLQSSNVQLFSTIRLVLLFACLLKRCFPFTHTHGAAFSSHTLCMIHTIETHTHTQHLAHKQYQKVAN